MSAAALEKTFEISDFRQFHGYQTSIIPLEKGHYFYLASWDRNPTRFARFSNVWLVTPDDRRILFSDPPESSEIVSIYHDFHEIYAASIAIQWIGSERFEIRCSSPEGALHSPRAHRSSSRHQQDSSPRSQARPAPSRRCCAGRPHRHQRRGAGTSSA